MDYIFYSENRILYLVIICIILVLILYYSTTHIYNKKKKVTFSDVITIIYVDKYIKNYSIH